jgi:hypothetical protein
MDHNGTFKGVVRMMDPKAGGLRARAQSTREAAAHARLDRGGKKSSTRESASITIKTTPLRQKLLNKLLVEFQRWFIPSLRREMVFMKKTLNKVHLIITKALEILTR